jgi:hypothetical protein
MWPAAAAVAPPDASAPGAAVSRGQALVATHAGVEAGRRQPASRYELHLLGTFRAVDRGRELLLPPTISRLLADLAIARRSIERTRVANALWTDKSEERAHANLRSCLWRAPDRSWADRLHPDTPAHWRGRLDRPERTRAGGRRHGRTERILRSGRR